MHSINWPYAILMLAAIATCSMLLKRFQASLPLTGVQKLGIGIGAFCGAMIGAKLPFVLADWENLLRPATWMADGKTILFGIVGGYFGVELAKWILQVKTKTGDTFAVPVAVATGIGRLACFQAGCCYGTPTNLPWGISFPTAGDSLRRHPTQIYETIFHWTAAGCLAYFLHRGWFRGQLIKLYILAYLAYRFLSEFLRPEAQVWSGLTGYQGVSLVLIPLFVWLWVRDQQIVGRSELHVQ